MFRILSQKIDGICEKKSFFFILTFVFLFSSLILPSLFASADENDIPSLITDEEEFEPVINVLSAVEELPNDVIDQSPEKIVNWLSEKTGYTVYINENETIQNSR